MKKIYLSIFTVLTSLASQAQITAVTYRGAFAPAPAAQWTDNWTNFDPQNTVYPTPDVTVPSGNISTDTHWTADHTYLLSGQTYITNGATLTIDAGTIIRADHTAVGAGLFVTKGSKVMAIGTAQAPIVFTSDNAEGSRNKGDWGGIILLGKGSYNINNGINNIEGIAVSANTEFGGGTTPDDNDNSGTLKYVRVEFGGYIYAANQEINGLTFGAIGRGTTIDYVQCSFTNDDSFEWFGGAVNCTHLVAYRGLDDDFDTDNGFSGNVQFILGIRDPQISDNPSVSTSEGFECDNNATSSGATPYTNAIFTNCTLIGPSYRLTLPNGGTLASGYKRAARLRRNNKLRVFNSAFIDFQEGLHIDGYVPPAGTTTTTEGNALANELKWKSNVLAGIVTANKAVYVNTPTQAAPNNIGFDIATWYAAGNNQTVATNANLLTKPYDLSDATLYTGLDYRPYQASTNAKTAGDSILIGTADFTDPAFAGLVLATDNFGVENATSSLSAYPNPFVGGFKLEYISQNSNDVKVNVYNAEGKVVETKSMNYATVNSYEFGKNFTTGLYVVVVNQGNITKTYKVVKE